MELSCGANYLADAKVIKFLFLSYPEGNRPKLPIPTPNRYHTDVQ